MSDNAPAPERTPPGEKVKQFPAGARRLSHEGRRRGASSTSARRRTCATAPAHYFTKAAAEDDAHRRLVKLIADIDFVPADTEVDALLMEARLIKDIQPRFNVDLKDDKTFPYLQIRMREDFPRVEFTRTPRAQGRRLYGPFTSAKSLRAAIQVLQRIFQFRTCSLDIKPTNAALALVSPVPLAQHPSMHRPVQFPRQQGRVSQADPPAAHGARRQEGRNCSREMEARR